MIVYVIRNRIDGKCYVGQTVNCLESRYRIGKNTKSWTHRVVSPHLRRAISKYGCDNFEIEILEQDVESVTRLDALEIYHIQRLKTMEPHGYNCTSGGQGGIDRSFSTSARDKLAHIRTKGRVVSLLNNLTGEIRDVINLSRFAEENDLQPSNLNSMVQGYLRFTGVWSLSSYPMRFMYIDSPEGETYTVLDGQVGAFCRRYGLHQSNLTGSYLRDGDWTCSGFLTRDTVPVNI